MKPMNIVLLVLAGALGGAVIMKVAERPHAAARGPASGSTVGVMTPARIQTPPPPPVANATPALPAGETPAPVQKTEQAVPEFAAPAHPRVASGKPFRSRSAAPRTVAAKPQPVERSWTPSPSNVMRVQVPPLASQPVQVAQDPIPAQVASAPAQPELAKPDPIKEVPPVRPEPENATPALPAPNPIPPEPNRVTLNAGMLIPVRLVDGLSSDRNQAGDPFTATLDRELVVDGFVIAERGARVEGRVSLLDRGSKLGGGAELTLELNRVHLSDGQAITVQTDGFDRRSNQTHAGGAEKVGAGAAVGAIIGAIAGGGKGAAIGAGAGAGVGAGGAAATRQPAALPSETRITFRLRTPVTVTERVSQ